MNPENKNKRIAKNTLVLYVRMIVVLFLTFYISRLILHNLGIVDYGIYNVVFGFVSMFSFFNTSMTACIQRFYNYELGKNGDEGISHVFTTSIIIQLFLAFIIFILVESLGFYFFDNKLEIPIERMHSAQLIYQSSIAIMVLMIFQVPFQSLVICYERMNVYALVCIVDVVLKLLVTIVIAYLPGDSLVEYGFLLLLISVINLTFYIFYVFNKFKFITLKFKLDKSLLKKMLSFSSWSMFGSFAQICRFQGLNVLLNMFFGPVVNAAQGLAMQIKGGVTAFISNITTAAQPQIVQSYAVKDENRFRNLLFTISKICYIMLYMMVLPLILEMDFVLNFWLGENVPQYTSVFARIILFTSLIDVFNNPITICIYSTGKIRGYNLLTSLLGILLLPISYFILNFQYPPESVYYVSLIISIFVEIVSIYFLKIRTSIKISEYLSKVLFPLLIFSVFSCVIPFFIYYNLNPSAIRFILTVTIVVVVTIFLGYYFCLNNNERELVKKMVYKKLKIKK